MKKRPIVIIDTNLSTNRKSIETFLGFRDELSKFAANAEIILPKVVVDEIRNQKERFLLESKESFLKNPYKNLLKIIDDSVHSYNTSELLDEVLLNEDIPHKIVDIENKKSAFERIYGWAIKNSAPFALDTDKGFKDACVAVTVEEIANKNEMVFLCTKDLRLKEAFETDPRVKIVGDYDEFKKYSTEDFFDEYLIQKLLEELSITFSDFAILDSWQNYDDNWVLKYCKLNAPQLVIIDSEAREILGHTDLDPILGINSLESSGSFETTHNCIAFLTDLFNYLSLNHFHKLINIFLENDQIYSIGTDPDVKDFFFRIYEKIKLSLDIDTNAKLEHYLEVRT